MADFQERLRKAQRQCGAEALRKAREAGLSDEETALAVYEAARDAWTKVPPSPAPWHCEFCGAREENGDDWRGHDCLGAMGQGSHVKSPAS